jgi:pantoate--beta-alanine ligase
MKIYRDINSLKLAIMEIKQNSQTIGFVPTMGFLHKGHISLIEGSKNNNNNTVVSIFVNPLQFGLGEDYEKYPRDEQMDLSILRQNKVDVVFLPTSEEMYRDTHFTKISVKTLTEVLCGLKRPGHFDGVCTVIAKFLNIIRPDNVYFGLKDYQQYIVVKKMVADLNFDVNIVGMSIIRDNDGLALSSRNSYLSDEERQSALSLSKSFSIVENFLREGCFISSDIKKAIYYFIASHKHTRIDYIEIVDVETLKNIDHIKTPFLLALAVFVGKTRLIDNKIFDLKNYKY